LLADTYPLAVVVEKGLEFDDVWMPDNAHDLQVTVLVRVSKCAAASMGPVAQTDLEALVLQHPFDGGVLSTRGQLGLEDYSKGAVSHNLALRVGQVLVLSRLAILDLFTDDFCTAVSFATVMEMR
jgi:hypothetical protein